MQKPSRTLTGALMAALIVVSTAVAGPVEDGSAAYVRGDYVVAMRIFLPLADQGNAAAQFNLGKMYDLGYGVPRNDAEALKWYRKAADQGHAEAQLSLGLMYQVGPQQNYAKAVKWYRLAAEQDDPFATTMAQNSLGGIYYDGLDFAEAAKWYRRSAERNAPPPSWRRIPSPSCIATARACRGTTPRL